MLELLLEKEVFTNENIEKTDRLLAKEGGTIMGVYCTAWRKERYFGTNGVLENFLRGVPPKGEALPPRLFVIIGQVGAGKSTIAKRIAQMTGAIVVNANDIRLKLRKAQNSYANERFLGEELIEKAPRERPFGCR